MRFLGAKGAKSETFLVQLEIGCGLLLTLDNCNRIYVFSHVFYANFRQFVGDYCWLLFKGVANSRGLPES